MNDYTKPISEIKTDSQAVTIYNHPQIPPSRLRAIITHWRRIELSLPTCNRCQKRVYEKMQSTCLDCRMGEHKALNEIGVPFSACAEE